MVLNVGPRERIIRVEVGVLVICVAFLAPLTIDWRTVLTLVGLGSLITGFIRFCPLNALLGAESFVAAPPKAIVKPKEHAHRR